jgi:hypothetical protein
VFLANCCIGGYLVTAPTFAQVVFGHRIGSNIYGFFWCIIGTANFVQFAYVQGLSLSIGFDHVIYICLGMCIAALPFVIFSKFQGPWENSTAHLEFYKPDHITDGANNVAKV